VSGGTITTVAGNGIAGFSGTGGGDQRLLQSPLGVGVDTAGNIYVADQFNARIREISGGKITTVAGGGSVLGDGGLATLGSLNNPYDVVADNNGNLYIADYGDNRIRKVFAGIMTTVAEPVSGLLRRWRSGDPSAAQWAVGRRGRQRGNLYIADYGYNHVRKVSNGFISTVAGSGASGYAGDGGSAVSASLDGPVGVAVDAAGVFSSPTSITNASAWLRTESSPPSRERAEAPILATEARGGRGDADYDGCRRRFHGNILSPIAEII